MEILSPAGDFESLKIAISCGADAVYIGGKEFSARKNARNFTNDEIIEAINFCHLFGKKLYVTLNIVIKENEFLKATEYAKFLIENGVDGIIIQDLGLLCAVRRMSDDVKINASTQMTICSSPGVNLLKDLGVDRVVLSREMSKEEIKSIRGKTDVELETFVHGAMCMSWSGQCYLSSIIGGRSGNRGLCAQPCRLSYTLYKDGVALTDNKPLLCMKDLCLADKIKEISEYSDSAKIEGRMKSAEYTGIVTKVYKKAADGANVKGDIKNMLSFFSRGGSEEGYFNGRGFSKIMDYSPKEKVTATKEDVSEIKSKEPEKSRKISFVLTAKEGKPLTLRGESGSFSEEIQGEILERANSGIFDEERIKKQLSKLGDTPFELDKIETVKEDTPFVAVSTLNALRREVCNRISEKICESYKRKAKEWTKNILPERENTMPKLCIQVRTKEQLDAANSMGVTAKYMSCDLYKEYGTEKDVLVLPPLTKEGEKISFYGATRVMAQNLGQIKEAEGKILCTSERLNVTNAETVRVLSELGLKRVTLSTELNLREIREITDKTSVSTEAIVYGRLPVMLMENCVIKSAYKCTKGEGAFELSDRLGERFPIICEGCRNVLLNSVPVYMADKMEDILKLNLSALRLVFTTEGYDETRHIIGAYKSGLMGKTPHRVFEKITRGHFYRGVE